MNMFDILLNDIYELHTKLFIDDGITEETSNIEDMVVGYYNDKVITYEEYNALHSLLSVVQHKLAQRLYINNLMAKVRGGSDESSNQTK